MDHFRFIASAHTVLRSQIVDKLSLITYSFGLYAMRLLENNRGLLTARRRTFRIPFISLCNTLFAVAFNHAAKFTPSTSILFLLYCAAALLLSIFHVSAEVLVAIVRQPIVSMLNTHRCIVLVSAILACGWFILAWFLIKADKDRGSSSSSLPLNEGCLLHSASPYLYRIG